MCFDVMSCHVRRVIFFTCVINIVSKVFRSILVLLILVAVCLYAALFEIQLKKNVLRPEDNKVGFESTDRARLDYSFWILLGASGVVIISPCIFLLSKLHLTHYFQTSSRTKEPAQTDHSGVMLY